MTEAEIRAAFLDEINRVAPDIEPETVSDDDHLQDDLELDSMDILNLAVALHERFGISIPERDYIRISTPEAAVGYLAEKMGN